VSPRARATTLSAAASVAAVAIVLGLSGAAPTSPRAPPAVPPAAAHEDCTTRSEANFPGAFTDRRNLVVGPLVLVGGAYTSASTVREFGGNKFPLLVKAGHTVTLAIAPRARRVAGMAYGPLPEGEVTLRDTHRAVRFQACRPGRASRRYRPEGPSSSYADGVPVTFWSGFVLARAPACVPLDVYVDDEPSPRHVGFSLGRRCGR
jgi:hypothetical protein